MFYLARGSGPHRGAAARMPDRPANKPAIHETLRRRQ